MKDLDDTLKVVLHEQGFYFFLKKGDNYFLDVLYEKGFMGFSLTFILNSQETHQYMINKKQYIDELAKSVQYNSNRFSKREVQEDEFDSELSQVIKEWWADESSNYPQ